MAKRKIIEDSDDENDREATPPLKGCDAAQRMTVEAGDTPPYNTTASTDPSTGSTVPLDHEIQTAHNNLMLPTPKSIGPPADSLRCFLQADASSPATASNSKRRKIEDKMKESRAKVTAKARGSQDVHHSLADHDFFEFHGSSDSELYSVPRAEHKRRLSEQGIALSVTGEQIKGKKCYIQSLPNHPSEKPDDMAEDAIDELAQNIIKAQSSMPPPTSKHVLAEQSDTMDPNNIHANHGSMPEESAPSNTLLGRSTTSEELSSVPNGLMPIPMTPCNEKSGEGEIRDHYSHGNEEELLEPSLSASLTSSIKVMTKAGYHGTGKDHPETKTNHQNDVSRGLHTIQNGKPIVLLREQRQHEFDDELSLPMSDVKRPPIQISQPEESKDKKTDIGLTQNLGSDENVVGLPKELYQPRPSRSRSGQNSEDLLIPTDYSKRPEAIQKKKRKSQGSNSIPLKESMHKAGEVNENKSLKVPEKAVSVHNSSSGTQGSECHDREEVEPVKSDQETADLKDTSVAEKPASKKQRGRPRKAPQASESEANDENFDEQDQPSAISGATVAPVAKKSSRKRGRPSEKAVPIIEERSDDESGASGDEKPTTAVESSNETNQIPEETTGNGSPSKTSSPAKPSRLETPPKQTVPLLKGPDKHSPLSTGKVAYRVGLSKKARIQPLLKSLRK